MRVIFFAAATSWVVGVEADLIDSITDTLGDCAECLQTGGDGDCTDECDIIGNADDAINECCTWWSCDVCPDTATTTTAGPIIVPPPPNPTTTATIAADTTTTTTTSGPVTCSTDADCPAEMWCFTSTNACAYPSTDACAEGGCGEGDGDCDPGDCADGLYCDNDLDNCAKYHDVLPDYESGYADCCIPIHCESDADCEEGEWCFTDGSCKQPSVDACVDGDCGEGDGDCDAGQCAEGLYCSDDLNNCGIYHGWLPDYDNGGDADCCVPQPCDSDGDCPSDMWCFTSTGTCQSPSTGACAEGGCGEGDGDCDEGDCAEGLYCDNNLDNCGVYHEFLPEYESGYADCCVPDVGDPDCDVIYQGEVCFSATGDSFVDQAYFTSNYEGTIDGAYVEYVSGSVDCNNGGEATHWGCDATDHTSNYIGVFLVEEASGTAVYPADGTYNLTDSSGAWYNANSQYGWSPDSDALYFPGTLDVTSGQGFYLTYGETFLSHTLTDNSGTTCASVSWLAGECSDIAVDNKAVREELSATKIPSVKS